MSKLASRNSTGGAKGWAVYTRDEPKGLLVVGCSPTNPDLVGRGAMSQLSNRQQAGFCA